MKVISWSKIKRVQVNPRIYKGQKALNMQIDSRKLKMVQMESKSEKEEEHKKFQLSTFFAPKKIQVDSKNLQVGIDGLLTSTFGKRGFEQKSVKYLLSFDFVAGHLKLKEFVQLVDKDEKNI